MSEIQLRNLSKSYSGTEGDHAAVSEVSLTIVSGEFVTLLGPSGCGKTTTLRLIAGYLVPDAGEIRVAGQLLSSSKSVVPPESRGMGMVFQNYAVWPHKTVFENVAFGLMLRKVSKSETRERVERVLDLVNLAGLDSRYPSELSGGQQQRVALARSLVVEPAVLLLDEPLSNLDAKLRERMRAELKTLQRRTGITFIYVTHDQSEALALSDHIAVMHAGRLQQYGTPREVYCEPANHIVADFMGLVNLLPARLIEVTGTASVFESGPVRMTIPRPSGMQVGARADLSIRPETIRLAASEVDLPGAFPARVLEQTYLGNLNEYVIAAGETQLRVQADAQAFFPVGSEVFALIDAQQCRAFASADTDTP
jgi:iron(III) transport system ATP-binding protein